MTRSASPAPPPRAVLLDLCDTLVRIEADRLPRVRLGELEFPSTVGIAHAAADLAPRGVTLEAFAGALWGVSMEIREAHRGGDGREVPSAERFRRALTRAGLPDDAATARLGRIASEAHLEALVAVTVLPRGHGALLERLRRRAPIALVSNFDAGEPVRRMLRRLGILECFSAVVVSADVGWRKPHPRIFRSALDALAVAPAEALFVGDLLREDVGGAQAIGMRAAWFAPQGEDPPEGFAPAIVLRRLAEIERLLGD